jgi:hypothetical protein
MSEISGMASKRLNTLGLEREEYNAPPLSFARIQISRNFKSFYVAEIFRVILAGLAVFYFRGGISSFLYKSKSLQYR